MVEAYQVMESFYALIGPDGDRPAWWQMIIRSLIVFLTGLTLLRLGARRMFGRSTPFDMVLAIIIGSILSRAITGNSPFLATLAAAAVLVLLHWSVALLSYYSDGLSLITEGAKRELVTKGEINWKAMRRGKVGKSDLFKALRMQGITDLAGVQTAYLERSGEISVIARRSADPNSSL